MLSDKKGGIKYHFLSLWYDSTWDWTPVSQTIGELIRQMARLWGNFFESHFVEFFLNKLS